MLREARELAALHENIVIKLPITAESLAVIKQLNAEGHENFVRDGSDVCTNERCVCYLTGTAHRLLLKRGMQSTMQKTVKQVSILGRTGEVQQIKSKWQQKSI